jgi:photosystem II stability/assembly factor-like uncharacterized protein
MFRYLAAQYRYTKILLLKKLENYSMQSIHHLCSIALISALAIFSNGCATSTADPAPVRYTIGAQDTWQKLNTVPYRGKQDDIVFADAQTGWYGNGAGKIYKTADGGTTWAEQLNQSGTFVRALGAVDALHGLMGNVGTDYYPGVTDTIPLYETRDGGASWKAVDATRIQGPTVKGLCAIDVLKKKAIYQGTLQDRTIVHAAGRVGGPAFLMRSMDGGQTWNSMDLNAQAGAILDVKFFDENTGLLFAATNSDVEKSNGLILLTRDGGKTWKNVYQSTRPFELTWKASFPTREVGYATLQSYNPDKTVAQRYVLKTTNGGQSWQELPLVQDYDVREFGIGFIDANNGWVGTSTSGFQTTDGGATWKRVEMGRAVNKIRLLPTADGFVGYAIGVDVYKFTGKKAQ